jgi:hypothetical protein
MEFLGMAVKRLEKGKSFNSSIVSLSTVPATQWGGNAENSMASGSWLSSSKMK